MTINERAKCRCPVPKPGLKHDLFGAVQCDTCKKVANWKDFEPTATEVAT